MTRSRLSLLFAVLFGLLLMGCPTDGRRETYDYLRSPVTFAIDTVPANHPFCQDPTKNPFATAQECQSTRKYRLRWERPEDTVSFNEYRIYVDTTPAEAPGQAWSEVRKNRSLASFAMAGRPSSADSVIFYLTGTAQVHPQELSRGAPRLVALDTTGRTEDTTGRVVFAITTTYNESGVEGQPRYTWVITDDRFPPNPISPSYVAKSRSAEIAWSRPLDPTSFFDPKADSGAIAGYVLQVRRVNKGDALFRPTLSYRLGGVDRSAFVTFKDTTLRTSPVRLFWLPDSQKVFDRAGGDPRDSVYATLLGLTPRDTIDINLWARDLPGNANGDGDDPATRLLLTDTTQPTTPVLSLVAGSVTRNRFAFTFTASRDRVESNGVLVPAATPNANIQEYRITLRRVSGAGGESVIDSVLQLTSANRDNAVFTDTARYLPPGATYRVYVQAMDSTGYLSERDSLEVTTAASQFVGADSGATCPPGFIAMPQGQFYLGETAANTPGADEGGAGAGFRTIKSFCIEPREHLASAGRFRSSVTWQEAFETCRDLSPADSTHLCTEAEWERACEGTEPTPLLYGLQSERQDPAGVRYTCNIGTGDSVMAMSAALRDPTCISYDGAFDMAGNLAEWVLDPYTSTGYPGPASDTLYPGRPHTPVTSTSRRGFRGSHYLNPGSNPAALLRSARCSNRDYAVQLRPKPWPGCVSEERGQIVVLYGDQTKPPRCLPLPDSLASLPITSLSPGRDTNQILFLVQGRPNPVSYFLGPDTTYRNLKPVSALLTARTLAIVTFENSQTGATEVDTLDAAELLNRSEAQRAVVFAREASPPWTVRKANGVYEIKFLHAYARSQGVQAKTYYSNRALGFRCCSKPRAP